MIMNCTFKKKLSATYGCLHKPEEMQEIAGGEQQINFLRSAEQEAGCGAADSTF